MDDPKSTIPPVAGAPVQPAGEPPAPTTPAPTDAEPFDKERAMATITKLREFEKAAKGLEKKVAEYEAAEKKRKESEMSDLQKAQTQFEDVSKQADEWKTKYEQTTQEIAVLRLRSEVERHAHALGFQNPEDAYLLADMTGVEMDDEGKLKGVKETLEKLLKTRPYLAKSASAPHIGTPRPGQRPAQPNGGEPKKNVLGIRL
jgi:hypothetical protein